MSGALTYRAYLYELAQFSHRIGDPDRDSGIDCPVNRTNYKEYLKGIMSHLLRTGIPDRERGRSQVRLPLYTDVGSLHRRHPGNIETWALLDMRTMAIVNIEDLLNEVEMLFGPGRVTREENPCREPHITEQARRAFHPRRFTVSECLQNEYNRLFKEDKPFCGPIEEELEI